MRTRSISDSQKTPSAINNRRTGKHLFHHCRTVAGNDRKRNNTQLRNKTYRAME